VSSLNWVRTSQLGPAQFWPCTNAGYKPPVGLLCPSPNTLRQNPFKSQAGCRATREVCVGTSPINVIKLSADMDRGSGTTPRGLVARVSPVKANLICLPFAVHEIRSVKRCKPSYPRKA
jgi:hypothetical protein